MINKKAASIGQISFMILSIFAFSYLMSSPTYSDSAPTDTKLKLFFKSIKDKILSPMIPLVLASDPSYCCERTTDGARCINAPEDECASGYNAAPTFCEATSYCQSGTCYDSTQGTCMGNTPKAVCDLNEGATWDARPMNEIPQCQLGCCVLSDQAAFVSLTRCKHLSSIFGVENDFRTDITDELSCIATAQSQEKGACVYENDFERVCDFTTRADCGASEGGTTDENGQILITSEKKFYPGFLCSADELATSCARQTSTTCYQGDVYWQDSCDNLENVYSNNKELSWNNGRVAKPEDVVQPSDGSNINNGNCDYLLGTRCAEYESRLGGPEFGNYYCQTNNCGTDEDGNEIKNGESWCYVDGNPSKYSSNASNGVVPDSIENIFGTDSLGGGKDPVGSRYYREVCVDGKIRTESCADYRNEICINGSVTYNGGEFSTAACRANKWQDCTSVDNSVDCENTAKRNCIWIEDPVPGLTLGDINENVTGEWGVCAPSYPPGLKFWEESAGEVCGQATAKCTVEYEKGALQKLGEIISGTTSFNGNYIKKGEECLNGTWAIQANRICTSMGDCGGYVNYAGEYTDDGYTWIDPQWAEPTPEDEWYNIAGRTPGNWVPERKTLEEDTDVTISQIINAQVIAPVTGHAIAPVTGHLTLGSDEYSFSLSDGGETYNYNIRTYNGEEVITQGTVVFILDKNNKWMYRAPSDGEYIILGSNNDPEKDSNTNVQSRFTEAVEQVSNAPPLEGGLTDRADLTLQLINENAGSSYKAGVDESCNVNADCQDGLVCNRIAGTCQESGTNLDVDTTNRPGTVPAPGSVTEGGNCRDGEPDCKSGLECQDGTCQKSQPTINLPATAPSLPASLSSAFTFIQNHLSNLQSPSGDNANTDAAKGSGASEVAPGADLDITEYRIMCRSGEVAHGHVEKIGSTDYYCCNHGIRESSCAGDGSNTPETPDNPTEANNNNFTNEILMPALEGLAWAGAAFGAVQSAGAALGWSDDLTTPLSIAGAVSGATLKWAQLIGEQTGWWGGWASLGIAAGAGVITFAIAYKDHEQKVVEFTCQPWQAPIGGDNCEICNDENLPCSDYKCHSLGLNCELVNKGTEDELCVNVDPGNVDPPVITPQTDFLTRGYGYTNVVQSPPSPGFEIIKLTSNNQRDGDGCIPAFTPIEFGVSLDEPAQCKISLESTTSYDDMATYMGGSNLYKYNHTEALSLPSAADLENSSINIQNGKDLTLFMRCKDKNGNTNDAEYAIQLCVDPSPDTTAPIVESTSVQNGGCIAEDQSSAQVKFYTNEPADCKWSTQDQDYGSMQNTMTNCGTPEGLLFSCKSQLTGIAQDMTTFYVRCEDRAKGETGKNTMMESYEFQLHGSRGLLMYKLRPNESQTIYGAVEPMPVEISAETAMGCSNGLATCFYSIDKEDNYVQFYDTHNEDAIHTQKLYLGNGGHEVYIKCVDDGGNLVEDSTKFKLEIDKDAPVITRVYEDTGLLKLVTLRDSECSYTYDNCDFTFDEGIAMPYANSTIHVAEWSNDKTFYIKCRDEFKNIEDDCSMIVRPTANFL